MLTRLVSRRHKFHGLTLPHLLFPLFYSRAVHFSHPRGFSSLLLYPSAKNLPP
jgi:hypothetical protein